MSNIRMNSTDIHIPGYEHCSYAQRPLSYSFGWTQASGRGIKSSFHTWSQEKVLSGHNMQQEQKEVLDGHALVQCNREEKAAYHWESP